MRPVGYSGVEFATQVISSGGVALGRRGCRAPQTFILSASLQYTIIASRRWNARKAFFVGKFGLREVFFVGKLGLRLLQNFAMSAPLYIINMQILGKCIDVER